MITSGTLFDVVAFLIFVFLLARYHKAIKRPLIVFLMLGVYVLSHVISKVIQHTWVNVLHLLLMLVLSLVLFLFLEKGILGLKGESQNRNIKKWQEKHPRLFKFHQKHPRLPDALLYGSVCAFFTYGISLTIMNRYTEAWASLGISYFRIDERLARAMNLSEGMNSPFRGLLLIIFIWSAVTLVVAFVCSLFVRDRTGLRMVAIPMLAQISHLRG